MSTQRIHIEGMGVIGSLLAWQLRDRAEFTWSDNDSEYCAWPACSGIIYWSGDAFDMDNYNQWSRWHESRVAWLTNVTERCDYWYSTKSAPHGGRYKAVQDIGPIRMGTTSLHFNAQTFVANTRSFFFRQRSIGRPPKSRLIVAHGFSERLHHYYWGWVRKVELSFAPKLERHTKLRRPCFYFRRGRFVMCYAYPVPGKPREWYAGTSLIYQTRPHRLGVEDKYKRWERNLRELSGGLVKVKKAGDFIEGWRPAADPADKPLVKMMAGNLVIRPLWNSGVRHAPALLSAVLERVGLKLI